MTSKKYEFLPRSLRGTPNWDQLTQNIIKVIVEAKKCSKKLKNEVGEFLKYVQANRLDKDNEFEKEALARVERMKNIVDTTKKKIYSMIKEEERNVDMLRCGASLGLKDRTVERIRTNRNIDEQDESEEDQKGRNLVAEEEQKVDMLRCGASLGPKDTTVERIRANRNIDKQDEGEEDPKERNLVGEEYDEILSKPYHFLGDLVISSLLDKIKRAGIKEGFKLTEELFSVLHQKSGIDMSYDFPGVQNELVELATQNKLDLNYLTPLLQSIDMIYRGRNKNLENITNYLQLSRNRFNWEYDKELKIILLQMRHAKKDKTFEKLHEKLMRLLKETYQLDFTPIKSRGDPSKLRSMGQRGSLDIFFRSFSTEVFF